MRFLISLPELEHAGKKFLSRTPHRADGFSYAEYSSSSEFWRVSFKGQLCRSQTGKLRGIGEVVITKDNKYITYAGEWIGPELSVSYFSSDIATFYGTDKIIFGGLERKISENTTGPITHLHVDIGRRYVGIPVIHDGKVTLDYALNHLTNVSYEIEIDDTKQEEQFTLAEDFKVNRLVRDISFAAFGELKRCKYIIEKDRTVHIW